MRVIGGTSRGTPLIAPKGVETRPTADRVREAIFSILYSMGADSSRVLDLYAGTGALAIEALSRGAEHADLVDRAPAACAAIRKNLVRARMSDRARVHCLDAQRAIARLAGPFTLVFLDPPYADATIGRMLETLAASAIVAEGGTIVLEHAQGRTPPTSIGGLALHSDRRYGDTGVAFYC
ncbi:MAG: 16S rRNA (guanine(966)-N(2))-methyltransferase RsmD [Dehalococcoidia bacterium]